MWISPEDARSDFILAAAALLFGGALLQFVAGLPLYPDGTLALALLPLWILATSGYPAFWLVRYREQGSEGHGLARQGRDQLAGGIVLAAPVIVAGYLAGLRANGPVEALLGRIGGLFGGEGLGLTSTLLAGAILVAVFVSIVSLHGMLSARAPDAFRSEELPVLEALRTFGMGAVGVSTILGLLVLVQGRRSLATLALDVVPLLLLVVLADRHVETKDRMTRAAAVAPAAVVVVASVFASGGLFSGDLLGGLYLGALGGGLSVVVSALVATKRGSWAFVPVLAATVWAPTCLTLPTLVRICNLS
jgi:hypothetical protein